MRFFPILALFFFASLPLLTAQDRDVRGERVILDDGDGNTYTLSVPSLDGPIEFVFPTNMDWSIESPISGGEALVVDDFYFDEETGVFMIILGWEPINQLQPVGVSSDNGDATGEIARLREEIDRLRAEIEAMRAEFDGLSDEIQMSEATTRSVE